jgi:hypothetical protein
VCALTLGIAGSNHNGKKCVELDRADAAAGRAHASKSRRRWLRWRARSLLPRGPARLEFRSPE